MSYHRTTHAVWELTLKCNLSCIHCGSRAGKARPHELSTEEAIDLVRQLAEVGTKEVTLIGGEAFLRADWLQIARAVAEAGMRCTMTTGGYGLSLPMVRQMKAAGLVTVGVSVDGLEATHDYLRGRKGSWKSCFKAMSYIREVGLNLACNTQINRLSAPELPLLYELLRDAGVMGWQIQLTVPMGNAADQANLLMQPAELVDLYPMVARVVERANREGVHVSPGNNIGYYGPYERLLRGNRQNEWNFWKGSTAGIVTIGIEADGAIKADPSLPSVRYTGGNIREQSLREILAQAEALNFNTNGNSEHLWGFCKTCEFAELCRGGCPWTAHVFFDRLGNNPYCHHRALVQADRGVRERVELRVKAADLPFANGVFELVEEPLELPWPENDALHFTSDRVQWPESWPDRSSDVNSLAQSSADLRLDVISAVAASAQEPAPLNLTLLERQAWKDELSYFKMVLKAKRALDRSEEAAGLL